MLGGVVIGLTSFVMFTGHSSAMAVAWASEVLGLPFLLLLASLVFAGLLCLLKLLATRSILDGTKRDTQRIKWLQAGLQSCNGIATLALTFTLLGISLGIGRLSEGGLTPENINSVIADLTAHFSLAFMTSVIGLPLSAAMRTALIVGNASLMTVLENPLQKIVLDSEPSLRTTKEETASCVS
ncbi:hypothetical protein N9X39_00690 [Alphaproteobacteria bacterium]|nr:hypothetical protein [Alphaproteobacteria bacterium]